MQIYAKLFFNLGILLLMKYFKKYCSLTHLKFKMCFIFFEHLKIFDQVRIPSRLRDVFPRRVFCTKLDLG